ncbi:hypothetical protein [Actinomyces wuliandei]|uniref:hypothetical protein n=1 Tax=Actinomyces wuliandei TaxID=2057743 RepID=UPI001FAAC3E8|nr:hypothetical protein [Actinomyces wuliandei]
MTTPPNPQQPSQYPGASGQYPGAQQPQPGYGQPGGQPGAAPGYGQPGYAQSGYGVPGYGAPTGPAMGVGDGLSWAWSRLKANPLVLVVGFIVWTVLSSIGFNAETTVNGETYSYGLGLGFLGSLLSFVLSLLGTIALASVALRTAAGQRVTWSDFVSFPNLGGGLLAGLLSALAAILAGVLTFFLLGAGGIIVAYLLHFAVYVTTDKGVNGIEGITTSTSLLAGNAGQLIPFALAGFGLLALGVVTVVGWVVTVPLVELMTAYAYVRVQGHDVAR